MNKSLLVIFIIFLYPIASCFAAKPIKIILLGGQSNMVGMGKIKDLQEPLNKKLKKIKVWSQQGQKWQALTPYSYGFGPEIMFGHTLAEKMPDEDFRFIKYAVGGTALYNDWSPVAKGQEYVQFMKHVKAALKNFNKSGVEYEIVGMLWLQGESDAHENQAKLYYKNLKKFIAHMRSEFKVKEMPFVIARVRSFFGGKTGQAKIVRAAQVKIAKKDKYTDWFDTDDCSLIDPGHYDTKGLLVIGKRFADKWMKLYKKL